VKPDRPGVSQTTVNETIDDEVEMMISQQHRRRGIKVSSDVYFCDISLYGHQIPSFRPLIDILLFQKKVPIYCLPFGVVCCDVFHSMV